MKPAEVKMGMHQDLGAYGVRRGRGQAPINLMKILNKITAFTFANPTRFLMFSAFLFSAIMSSLAFSGCLDDKDETVVRKLNESGSVWFIDIDYYSTDKGIPDFLPQTCATIGKTVGNVELSGKYSTTAIVRCK